MAWRVNFEMDPVYPPEGSSEATRLQWKQMMPIEKRKSLILQQLEKCIAVTTVRAFYSFVTKPIAIFGCYVVELY